MTMPARPDMVAAITAEGKREGRTGDNNMWPINQLQIGDVYVADGFGKIVEGALIGSNLGSGIAAHSHTAFVFDAGTRDVEQNKEIANMNGFYRKGDPSAWKDMTLTPSMRHPHWPRHGAAWRPRHRRGRRHHLRSRPSTTRSQSGSTRTLKN